MSERAVSPTPESSTRREAGESSRKRYVDEATEQVFKKMKTELLGDEFFKCFADFLFTRYNKEPTTRGESGEAGRGKGAESARGEAGDHQCQDQSTTESDVLLDYNSGTLITYSSNSANNGTYY